MNTDLHIFVQYVRIMGVKNIRFFDKFCVRTKRMMPKMISLTLYFIMLKNGQTYFKNNHSLNVIMMIT